MNQKNKEFERLLPFKWREVELPVTNITLQLAHDLVEHKYWGIDGARVEATGLEPIRISATIPIANTIVPGKNERWQAGALYPDALRSFIRAFSNKTTGLLQHPELGGFSCKPERMQFTLSGEKQNCTEIDASWVTTNDDNVQGTPQNPLADLQAAARDLTASGADLRKKVPKLPKFTEDIESLGRRITSIGDRVTALSYRSAGLINRILYQANRIEASILRAKDATTWPAIEAIQKIKAAGFALLRETLSTRGVGLYTVPSTTTLAGVTTSLPEGTSVNELIRLNPNLVRGPVVRAGTIVRYPL